MYRRPSTIKELEQAVQTELERDVSVLVDEARSCVLNSRGQLQELSRLMDTYEGSAKRLDDNKHIVQTLADLLPPYVAKVRDVQTDFEDFDRNFPKLERSVKVYHSRSIQTAAGIDALRKQVETLTQRQEAFLKLSTIAPVLILLVLAVIWYAIVR
ncbi:hypothetical protein CPB86DRAFT_790793 [Serendipita vermifera]|nr:hypothetical protein CPB86DRAFT_790793 [Serendipita vermifera]